jgi:two-component system, NarL family, invasion response regulator UvrY
MENTIKIALVDDHVLLRNALSNLINGFDGCSIIHQANNGAELLQLLAKSPLPDIILLDLNMPIMDGFETAYWLKENHPDIHVLMLTMYDSELTLIRLLQAGVKGFLKKDIGPAELKFAITSVMKSGYYYSTQTAGRLANIFRNGSKENLRLQGSMLSEPEIRFLRLACTDLTYKEIAQSIGYTPRAVDALRDNLFVKLDVKSRVGLVMVAIKNGIVSITS